MHEVRLSVRHEVLNSFRDSNHNDISGVVMYDQNLNPHPSMNPLAHFGRGGK